MRERRGGERRKGKEEGVTKEEKRKLYKECSVGKTEQLKESRGGKRGSD